MTDRTESALEAEQRTHWDADSVDDMTPPEGHGASTSADHWNDNGVCAACGVAMPEPEASRFQTTPLGEKAVEVTANGITVLLVANDDGSVYVEASTAVRSRTAQVVVSDAFIDAYRYPAPHIRLSLR